MIIHQKKQEAADQDQFFFDSENASMNVPRDPKIMILA